MRGEDRLTEQLLQEQELHSPLQQLQEQGDMLIGLRVGFKRCFLVVNFGLALSHEG